MKKILLAILMSSIFSTTHASHLMGGQITATHINTPPGYLYEIKMTLYRDTLGIAMSPTETYSIIDSSNVPTSLGFRTLFAQPPVSLGNGVEEYTYLDTVNDWATWGGNFFFYWTNCCRNAAILNLPNPTSNSMFLYSYIQFDLSNCSPVFLAPPILVAQQGVPFTYNQLVYDANGDSISYALDNPLDAPTVNRYNIVPIPGYTLPPSDTSMPFSLDPVTGIISFLPNIAGRFVVSVLINEFRAGIQIGQIHRDMQIIVVPSPNVLRLFSSSSNIPPSAPRQIHIPAWTPLNLSVATTDPVDSDYLTIRANSSIFQGVNPPVYTYTDSFANATGLLTWTPTPADVRPAPYIVSFRTSEAHGNHTFYLDETFELFVDYVPTSIHEANSNGVDIYPNPTANKITVVTNSTNNNYTLYDITGKLLLKDISTTSKFEIDLSKLSSGIYFLTVGDKDKQVHRKIVKE